MRYIALFLLVVNIGYFGWNQYRPDAEPLLMTAQPRELLDSGLMLITEYQQQVENQQGSTVDSDFTCSMVEGFSNIDEAYGFIDFAISKSLRAQLSLAGELLPSQYRVYLPPSSSRTIATITLDSLSERIESAGLEVEMYLITRGILENSIALGVFSEMSAASLVRDQVVALGYRAIVDEIPQSTGNIRVELQASEAKQIENAIWLELAAGRSYLTHTENLCETIAQGTQFP